MPLSLLLTLRPSFLIRTYVRGFRPSYAVILLFSESMPGKARHTSGAPTFENLFGDWRLGGESSGRFHQLFSPTAPRAGIPGVGKGLERRKFEFPAEHLLSRMEVVPMKDCSREAHAGGHCLSRWTLLCLSILHDFSLKV